MDESDTPYSDAVLQLVDAGRKIDAIKQLREETGLSLKDAKHVIDKLSGSRQPAVAPPTQQGGADAVIKIIVAAVVLYLAYRFFTNA